MPEQKAFLAFITLFFATNGLSGIFINTFIYSVSYMSGEFVSALRAVLYYNLCMYASMAVFSVVVGIIGKNFNSRILMGIGIAAHMILFILLIALSGRCIRFIWLLGLLSGMGISFINLNYSISAAYVIGGINKEYCLKLQSIFSASSAILSPVIAGGLLQLIGGITGYTVLFCIVLIFSIISIICCIHLRYNDGRKGLTHFGNVFVYSIKNAQMRCCSVAEFIGGIRDGIMAFLIPIFLYSIDMSAVSVGIYCSIFALIQVIVSNRSTSKINQKNRSVFLFISCVLYAAIGFVFMTGIHKAALFSYGAISACAQSLFSSAAFSIFFGCAYKMPHADKKNTEILSVREFYTNLGRTAGVFAVLLIPYDTLYIIYAVIAAGIIQVLSWILLTESHSSLKKRDSKITIKLG